MRDREEYLLELIETKDYTELSEQDLILVHSQMSVEEYNNARLNLLAMNEIIEDDLQAIPVDYSMLETLNETDKKSNGVFKKIIGLRFSFVRVAAVFLTFFISYSLLLATLTTSGSEVEIRYVTKVDTIIQKEIVKLVDTIFVEKQIIVKQSNPKPDNNTIEQVSVNKPVVGMRNLKQAYTPVALAQLEKAKRGNYNGISKSNEESFIEFKRPISEYSEFEIPINLEN